MVVCDCKECGHVTVEEEKEKGLCNVMCVKEIERVGESEEKEWKGVCVCVLSVCLFDKERREKENCLVPTDTQKKKSVERENLADWGLNSTTNPSHSQQYIYIIIIYSSFYLTNLFYITHFHSFFLTQTHDF